MEYELGLQPDKMVNEVTKRKIRILKQHHNYVVDVNYSQQRGYHDQHSHRCINKENISDNE